MHRGVTSKKGLVDYRSIWAALSPADWKSLLEELLPGTPFVIKGGGLHSNCPWPEHADKTPSFWLWPKKGYGKCFGCQRFETNPIRLVSDITNKSWAESFLFFKKRFNLRALPAKLADLIQEEENKHAVLVELSRVFNESLRFAQEALLENPADPNFRFALPCLNYLKHRNIPVTKETLGCLPIGILPPLKLIKALVTKNLEQCLEHIQKWLTADYLGSLVFTYHSTPTTITGFRLRADFLRQDNRKDIVRIADSDKSPCGFFGLNHYIALLRPTASNSTLEALIMEGEFDVLANMVGQLKDGKPYDIVLGTGGSAESNLDSLQEFGVTRALIVPDSPEHGGDIIAKNLLSVNEIPMQVFNWPPQISAKDPDEAIRIHGWQPWLATLLERDSDDLKRVHFSYPHKWALEKLREQLSGVDPDDIRRIKEITGELGGCLNTPVEQRAYITSATKLTDLSTTEITEIIVGRDETEEGYIRRIILGLRESFVFIGLESGGRVGTRVFFWNKEKREMRSCNISRTSDIFTTLGADLGGMIFWARDKIGIPEWMQYKRTAKGSVPLSILEQDTLQRRYMEMALEELLKELPNLDKLIQLKSGSHYLDLETASGTGKRWAVVNGNNVYLGTLKDDCRVEWRHLDGPRSGKHYFNLVRNRWSTELSSVKDLVEGNSLDINETYDFLVTVLNKGWRFRNQIEDSEYLAAAMLLNPVSSALPRQLYIMINGSRGSGKSSFLSLISGSHPEFRLLEATFGMDSYTVAGFRKEMNNCALGAVLDEFEDTGNDSHSRHVRGILRDVRGLTSNPECRILRGNVENSEATEYTLKCQLWTAAIQYLRDEADVSRFVQIHTELVEGHPSPSVTLMDIFSTADFKRHRRTVTLGMYRHVEKLLRYIKELRSTYSSANAMRALSAEADTEIPSRYLDGVLLPAALIQLVGRNPHDFIRRFIRAKSVDLKRVVQTTHKQTLLDHILSAQIDYKRPNNESRHTTIRTLLGDATERYLLNDTDCGVMYIEFTPKKAPDDSMHRWLIVIWSDALHGVLRHVPQYRYETVARLKQLADSDKTMTVPPRATRDVPGGIRQHLKVGIRSSDYTIYDLSDLLQDWDQQGVT